MASAIARALDLAVAFEAARTPDAVGRRLLAGLSPFGARSLFAGSFARHIGTGDDETVAASRQLLAQISPPGWLDGYHRRGLNPRNPVIFAPARRATAFRWSDPGYDDLRNWAGLDLARELGIADGLAVPCHGPGGRVGVVSIGFERFDLSAEDHLAVALAVHVAHERMSALSPLSAVKQGPSLTPRERDCIAFVADGLSDSEIAARLGIAQVTAHAHVENAKRKLGARTRAQAVARLYAAGLF